MQFSGLVCFLIGLVVILGYTGHLQCSDWSSILHRSTNLLRVRSGHYSGLISQEHRWFESNTRYHFRILSAILISTIMKKANPVVFSRIVKWYNNRLITGHYKFDSCSGNQFLCRCGGVVQRNGLQNRKTVSSNLTTYSKLMLRQCSGLSRNPVTVEVTGSIPVRGASFRISSANFKLFYYSKKPKLILLYFTHVVQWLGRYPFKVEKRDRYPS